MRSRAGWEPHVGRAQAKGGGRAACRCSPLRASLDRRRVDPPCSEALWPPATQVTV